MQKKTLFVHIGAHRTATSSLQAFLHQQTDALIQRGFLYPLGVQRHFALANKLFSGQRDPLEVARDLDARASNKKHPIQSVILSDEDIAMRRDLSVFAAMREVFDVKFVYCLRRQDLWLESWYLQNVKWQWEPSLAHATLPEYLARIDEFHWIDYAAYVDHLETLVGRENVLLYVFERGQMPQGPIRAFADAVGLDVSGMPDHPHQNASFSPVIAELARQLPLGEAQWRLRAALEKALFTLDAEVSKSEGEASKLLLDHDFRASVMQRFEAGNRALAQRRFGREALFLDPLPGRDKIVGAMALPERTDEAMDRLIAPFVREIVTNINALLKD